MKQKKQTTLIIDQKTDKLFNTIGASHSLKNRGETAKVALMFLEAVTNRALYPDEVKASLNNIFETIVYNVQNSELGWCDEDNRPKLIG